MTGLHTGHTPVRANAGTVPLLPEDLTVAEVLRGAGYRNGGFGKWGLGDADTTGAATRKGFDEFFGYLHQTHAHDYYPEYLRDGEKTYPLAGNANGGRKQYSADLIQNRALAFIKSNADRPFFLYACTTLPHGRFEVPSDEPYSRRDWPDEHRNFAAMVTRADRHFGEILRTLRDLRLDRNTVVMVASDNGGTGTDQRIRRFDSTGPFRSQKGSVYEGGIRVPFIVRWPGRVKAGTATGFPSAFCDFLPTAAAIAGVPAPRQIDGISLLPALAGGGKPEREGLYWEQHGYNRKTQRLTGMMQAARMNQWKAVIPKPEAPLELYNLQADISESKDVAGAHPEIAAKLSAYIRSQHRTPRPHNNGNWEYTDRAAR